MGNNGRLKRVKGRTIPVLCNEHDDADTLLHKSIEKHAGHYKQFNKDEYVILYQDMTSVKDLPVCSTPFTLGKYKHDILKPYSKLNFWLCSTALEKILEIPPLMMQIEKVKMMLS
jgi:hypothetical protein